MVKDMCWSSVVALRAGKCTRWFQSNFRERKALHSQLVLHLSLQEHGISGKEASLSCTYVPTDVYAAWCSIQKQGSPAPDARIAVEGIAQIAGITTVMCLKLLPKSLEHFTFGDDFNLSLQRVTLPSSLRNLTFG